MVALLSFQARQPLATPRWPPSALIPCFKLTGSRARLVWGEGAPEPVAHQVYGGGGGVEDIAALSPFLARCGAGTGPQVGAGVDGKLEGDFWSGALTRHEAGDKGKVPAGAVACEDDPAGVEPKP